MQISMPGPWSDRDEVAHSLQKGQMINANCIKRSVLLTFQPIQGDDGNQGDFEGDMITLKI